MSLKANQCIRFGTLDFKIFDNDPQYAPMILRGIARDVYKLGEQAPEPRIKSMNRLFSIVFRMENISVDERFCCYCVNPTWVKKNKRQFSKCKSLIVIQLTKSDRSNNVLIKVLKTVRHFFSAIDEHLGKPLKFSCEEDATVQINTFLFQLMAAQKSELPGKKSDELIYNKEAVEFLKHYAETGSVGVVHQISIEKLRTTILQAKKWNWQNFLTNIQSKLCKVVFDQKWPILTISALNEMAECFEFSRLVETIKELSAVKAGPQAPFDSTKAHSEYQNPPAPIHEYDVVPGEILELESDEIEMDKMAGMIVEYVEEEENQVNFLADVQMSDDDLGKISHHDKQYLTADFSGCSSLSDRSICMFLEAHPTTLMMVNLSETSFSGESLCGPFSKVTNLNFRSCESLHRDFIASLPQIFPGRSVSAIFTDTRQTIEKMQEVVPNWVCITKSTSPNSILSTEEFDEADSF